MMVGTTALPMTAATRIEYCDWLMMPCESPNRDEIVPKVRPVDIKRVVYIASGSGDLKILVVG